MNINKSKIILFIFLSLLLVAFAGSVAVALSGSMQYLTYHQKTGHLISFQDGSYTALEFICGVGSFIIPLIILACIPALWYLLFDGN